MTSNVVLQPLNVRVCTWRRALLVPCLRYCQVETNTSHFTKIFINPQKIRHIEHRAKITPTGEKMRGGVTSTSSSFESPGRSHSTGRDAPFHTKAPAKYKNINRGWCNTAPPYKRPTRPLISTYIISFLIGPLHISF